MFVGFDSQNTSHSFRHYPNWNLGGLGDFSDWAQRVTDEKDKFSSCYLDDLGRHIPLALLVVGTHRLR